MLGRRFSQFDNAILDLLLRCHFNGLLVTCQVELFVSGGSPTWGGLRDGANRPCRPARRSGWGMSLQKNSQGLICRESEYGLDGRQQNKDEGY